MPTKQFPSIPTAEQEALQAPSVDPINTLGMAAGFGPITASKLLFQQILANAILPHMGKMNSIPLPNKVDAVTSTATGGPAHGQEIGDYLAYKNRMTPWGADYGILREARNRFAGWAMDSEPDSMKRKLFSLLLMTKSPAEYAAKYSGDIPE